MKKQFLILITTLISGILLGWIFFHATPAKVETHDHAAEAAKETIWTCAMHPQIRMHEPGKCPICAMELIPIGQSGPTTDPGAIHMTKEAAQLANVLTSVATKQSPVKEIRLYGKIQADERLLQSQVSYLPGRIEKLYVNFTGESVRKGQALALIYSPDLVTAQQELLETATTKESQPALYEASKEKLRLWKLTDAQVASIETSGKVKTEFEVFANTTGVISSRRINNGDYVSQGSVLFEVSDLSHIWIMFDAYESDLPYLSRGMKVSFNVQAIPGTDYTGNITFIDPVLDAVTRVARVRVEIGNQGGKLKPEMFATGTIKANLSEWKDKIVIPRTAVLWTGKRSVVYVKQQGSSEPVFKIREIELGTMLGNSYVVISGLSEGEEVVTQGAFSVDASAQLEGKPSMMNNDLSATDGATKSDPVKSEQKASQSTRKQLSIKVAGNCEMCKERIEKIAKTIDGISSAEWNITTKLLAINFDGNKTNSDKIQQAIAYAGHDTERFKASDEAYKKLPECCLYRK
ncbi:MAG: efflux RND transporter periplasmic adaptor subunit [Prolixibacteraceae bacterium]|jgi:Cu(I)/Ag(I) efflux system membrane fusion protein|nr:efflux RND transporter periplasmic adaptor subunit [Prolixibacteraceae bacterium]